MTERETGRDRPTGTDKARVKPGPAGGEAQDEDALFHTEPGPRIFGEGSYTDGGSNQEGNFKEREVSPGGARGSFDDAGGPGGEELLGGRRADQAAERSRRAREDKTTGPDESIDEN